MNHATARLVDANGNQLLSLNGNGITDFSPMLRSIDLGYASPRDVVTPSAAMDGDDDLTTNTASRGITAEVMIPVEGLAIADTIRALMHPGRRMWLYVQMPDWATERRVMVRGASLTLPQGPAPWMAQLGWKAPKPNLQDVTPTTVTLNPVGQAGGGMTLPAAFPVTFQPGLVPGAAVLTVLGTANAYPVFDIYGPCSGPLIRVVDTGAQLSFSGLSVNAGDYLHIDCAARTITLNNDPAQSQYNRLDFATSSWPTLPPGSPQVVFSPASSSGGCVANVTWASQWL